MNVNNFCLKCNTYTPHEWVVIEAPDAYQTHGSITKQVGWLTCLICKSNKKSYVRSNTSERTY